MKIKQKVVFQLNKRKVWSLITYTKFLAVIFVVMFIFTVLLSFKILSSECETRTQSESYVYNIPKFNKSVKLNADINKLAVIVPYRDRFEELLEFVPYIHNFIKKQNVDHEIFVLNQVDKFRFNRASLINVGFLETKNLCNYIVMHDVDLLPLNKNLSYSYPELPRHLAAPDLHPRYHYNKFIGGILLINREQFQLVNGLSNNYWGWGLEDDEFYVRLKEANLNITRPENISTGINNTFKHIHGKERKRDTTKCYNQREVTRKRDRKTGLDTVKYEIAGKKKLTIDEAPFTIINVKLHCDFKATPWCNCTSVNLKKKI